MSIDRPRQGNTTNTTPDTMTTIDRGKSKKSSSSSKGVSNNPNTHMTQQQQREDAESMMMRMAYLSPFLQGSYPFISSSSNSPLTTSAYQPSSSSSTSSHNMTSPHDLAMMMLLSSSSQASRYPQHVSQQQQSSSLPFLPPPPPLSNHFGNGNLSSPSSSHTSSPVPPKEPTTKPPKKSKPQPSVNKSSNKQGDSSNHLPIRPSSAMPTSSGMDDLTGGSIPTRAFTPFPTGTVGLGNGGSLTGYTNPLDPLMMSSPLLQQQWMLRNGLTPSPFYPPSHGYSSLYPFPHLMDQSSSTMSPVGLTHPPFLPPHLISSYNSSPHHSPSFVGYPSGFPPPPPPTRNIWSPALLESSSSSPSSLLHPPSEILHHRSSSSAFTPIHPHSSTNSVSSASSSPISLTMKDKVTLSPSATITSTTASNTTTSSHTSKVKSDVSSSPTTTTQLTTTTSSLQFPPSRSKKDREDSSLPSPSLSQQSSLESSSISSSSPLELTTSKRNLTPLSSEADNSVKETREERSGDDQLRAVRRSDNNGDITSKEQIINAHEESLKKKKPKRIISPKSNRSSGSTATTASPTLSIISTSSNEGKRNEKKGKGAKNRPASCEGGTSKLRAEVNNESSTPNIGKIASPKKGGKGKKTSPLIATSTPPLPSDNHDPYHFTDDFEVEGKKESVSETTSLSTTVPLKRKSTPVNEEQQTGNNGRAKKAKVSSSITNKAGDASSSSSPSLNKVQGASIVATSQTTVGATTSTTVKPFLLHSGLGNKKSVLVEPIQKHSQQSQNINNTNSSSSLASSSHTSVCSNTTATKRSTISSRTPLSATTPSSRSSLPTSIDSTTSGVAAASSSSSSSSSSGVGGNNRSSTSSITPVTPPSTSKGNSQSTPSHKKKIGIPVGIAVARQRNNKDSQISPKSVVVVGTTTTITTPQASTTTTSSSSFSSVIAGRNPSVSGQLVVLIPPGNEQPSEQSPRTSALTISTEEEEDQLDHSKRRILSQQHGRSPFVSQSDLLLKTAELTPSVTGNNDPTSEPRRLSISDKDTCSSSSSSLPDQNQSVLNFINARGLDLLVDLVEGQPQQQLSSTQATNSAYQSAYSSRVSTPTMAVGDSEVFYPSSSQGKDSVESNLDLLSILCEQRMRDEEERRKTEAVIKRRLSCPTGENDTSVPSIILPSQTSAPMSSGSHLSSEEERESMIPLKKRVKRFSSLDPSQLESPTATTAPWNWMVPSLSQSNKTFLSVPEEEQKITSLPIVAAPHIPVPSITISRSSLSSSPGKVKPLSIKLKTNLSSASKNKQSPPKTDKHHHHHHHKHHHHKEKSPPKSPIKSAEPKKEPIKVLLKTSPSSSSSPKASSPSANSPGLPHLTLKVKTSKCTLNPLVPTKKSSSHSHHHKRPQPAVVSPKKTPSPKKTSKTQLVVKDIDPESGKIHLTSQIKKKEGKRKEEKVEDKKAKLEPSSPKKSVKEVKGATTKLQQQLRSKRLGVKISLGKESDKKIKASSQTSSKKVPEKEKKALSVKKEEKKPISEISVKKDSNYGTKSEKETSKKSSNSEKPSHRRPSLSEENQPWFAIRRSERIFFAHEYGPAFHIKDPARESDTSSTDESGDEERKGSKSDDQLRKRKTSPSPSSSLATSRAKRTRPNHQSKVEIEGTKNLNDSKKSSSTPSSAPVPGSCSSSSPKKKLTHATSNTTGSHLLRERSDSTESHVSESLQNVEAASTGSVYCWEFVGLPIKKTYTKAPTPPNSTSASSTPHLVSPKSAKQTHHVTIRKDFFTRVKRTRVNLVAGKSPSPSLQSVSSISQEKKESEESKKDNGQPIIGKNTEDSQSQEMILNVGDCAIFCSSSPTSGGGDQSSGDQPQFPFIGRIDSFWREVKLHPPQTTPEKNGGGDYNLRKGGTTPSPGKKAQSSGNSSTSPKIDYDSYHIDEEEKMMVKVRWFYHPPEAISKSKKLDPTRVLIELTGALFESTTHFDENDVQTIACKCLVLPYDEFKRKREKRNGKKDKDNSTNLTNSGNASELNKLYYLAGKYEPLVKEISYESGVPVNL